jgi:hypothetical protein
MVPLDELPLMLQVKLAEGALGRNAVNCAVPLTGTLALPGKTETGTEVLVVGGGVVEPPPEPELEPLPPQPTSTTAASATAAARSGSASGGRASNGRANDGRASGGKARGSGGRAGRALAQLVAVNFLNTPFDMVDNSILGSSLPLFQFHSLQNYSSLATAQRPGESAHRASCCTMWRRQRRDGIMWLRELRHTGATPCRQKEPMLGTYHKSKSCLAANARAEAG